MYVYHGAVTHNSAHACNHADLLFVTSWLPRGQIRHRHGELLEQQLSVQVFKMRVLFIPYFLVSERTPHCHAATGVSKTRASE